MTTANNTAESREGLTKWPPSCCRYPPCCWRPSYIGGCPVCTAQFIQQGCEVIGSPLSERSLCVPTLSSRLVGQGDSTVPPTCCPLGVTALPALDLRELSQHLGCAVAKIVYYSNLRASDLGLALPACAWAPDSKRQTVASPSCFRSNCPLTT